MSLIQRMLKQKAIYWPITGKPDQFGKPVLDVPVQIMCRWEETDIEALQDKQETSEVGTVVYVDRDVVQGGKLKLGVLTSSSSAVGAWEIIRFVKNPRYHADQWVRKALLSR